MICKVVIDRFCIVVMSAALKNFLVSQSLPVEMSAFQSSHNIF
jgi:hypothetical protein